MEFNKEHEKQLNQIYTTLVGDEFNPDGLICEHKKLKKRVDNHDVFIKVGSLLLTILLIIVNFWERFKNLF